MSGGNNNTKRKHLSVVHNQGPNGWGEKTNFAIFGGPSLSSERIMKIFVTTMDMIANYDADDSATTRYKLKSNAATRIKSPFSEPHTPNQKFKSAGPDSFSVFH